MAQHLYLYENISERLRCHIRQGNYRSGERLPSVRSLSRLFRVSVNTITQCFRQLEADGFIEVRPRSGVFVADAIPSQPQSASVAHFPLLPVEVSLSEDILHFMEPHVRPELVHFGIALPSPELVAVDRILKTMREVTRTHALESWDYTHPHGQECFTHQLSRRSINYPVPINQGELLVTNGCMEGIELALRALTQPGDTVAVESPTYYGTLLALGVMQRRALEIPTHYRDGICLYSLEQAFKRGQVKACLLCTNAQNPLGFTMPAERKRRLVALAVKYDVPIIENDIWGDTVYAGEALPAKAYDETGMVIYCNSFSKTLMPGLRLGWVAPGRYHHRIRELKQISSITTASVPQLMMARLMESGFYAQHIQQLRAQLAVQATHMAERVRDYFPAFTRVDVPTGGCAIWVGLPRGGDSRVLFDRALAAGIHVFPGTVFSAGPRHNSFLRLNAGNPPSERIDSAIAQLGALAASL